MSDTATATAAPKAGRQLGFNQVMVKGRIEESRRHENTTYTRVLCPAADEYSRPQTLEIRSKARIGQKGDTVQQLCYLGGFTRKAFTATDRSTGEQTKVTPVDMTLDAIED
ncbi:single-stranded DNA-binding protein [Comamonas fluminis]|uniref:single-stranded DNA-binding protein n=1 Tax=Comamonas fluminis TaxID=2796366 RepID=UPI001C465FFC|nr:single-stranded DNA-binding protein [Comamonas fluminis]